ncbi:hypothetical protein K458DRAFT_382369 [Lentithecium fluviatile CBS 122367]|uniref:Uncharacterized protein n=1 Tax=Lentithecium fluviatile CBS 122367 TaxID=1168545 RepID=A0A6G1JJQ7_9PLEO|nr:hypothetical protein K458DRAFT_382369 [Lentithecium fluviatile CBS 122367]
MHHHQTPKMKGNTASSSTAPTTLPTRNGTASWNSSIRKAKSKLKAEGLEEDFEEVDWNVQSGLEFDNAGYEEVSSHFNTWITSGAEPYDTSAHFRACIIVDDASLASVDSFLSDGKPLDTFDHLGTARVFLVHRDKGEGKNDDLRVEFDAQGF